MQRKCFYKVFMTASLERFCKSCFNCNIRGVRNVVESVHNAVSNKYHDLCGDWASLKIDMSLE